MTHTAIALSTTVGRDFVRPRLNDDMAERLDLFGQAGILILTAKAAVITALFYRGLITPLAVFGPGVSVQLMTPMFGAPRRPRASDEAALLAPAIGTPLMIARALGLLTNPLGGIGLRGLLLGLIVNIVMFVVITYLTSPVSEEQIERYHGLLKDER